MNLPSGSAEVLLSDIYTQFSSIAEELEKRRNDKTLCQKVSDFLDNEILPWFGSEPRAVLSRPLATPNAELDYFLDLSNLLNFKPLILEYPDKFVARNRDKYHLARLLFYKKTKDLRPFTTSSIRILDFNKYEGCELRAIPTFFSDVSVADFHHHFLYKVFPELKENVVDFSEWFKAARSSSSFYYLRFLTLFICHGVLFDNFLLDDKEESGFIEQKFIPSFKEAERIFGVKPLIFPLLPFEGEKNPYWLSYKDDLRQIIDTPTHNHMYSKI